MDGHLTEFIFFFEKAVILALSSITFFFFKSLVNEVKNMRSEIHDLNVKLEKYLISLENVTKRLDFLEKSFLRKMGGDYGKD